MDRNTIIYEDLIHHVYMLSDKTGYITRRATFEDLISMNIARKENGLSEIKWNPDYIKNLAVKREIPKRVNPCPNCGANSWMNNICEYCGTEIE